MRDTQPRRQAISDERTRVDLSTTRWRPPDQPVPNASGYSRFAGRSRSGRRGIGGQAFGSSGVPQFSGSSREEAIDGMSGRAADGEAGR